MAVGASDEWSDRTRSVIRKRRAGVVPLAVDEQSRLSGQIAGMHHRANRRAADWPYRIYGLNLRPLLSPANRRVT